MRGTLRRAFFALPATSACVPQGDVQCPKDTHHLGDECVVACAADDECLIGEICDPNAGACVNGSGDRPIISDLSAIETTVAPGRPVHLFYSVMNATHVAMDNHVLVTAEALNGDVWTKPIDQTT